MFFRHDIFTDYREQFNTEQFIIVPAVESSVVLYRARAQASAIRYHSREYWERRHAGCSPLGTYGHMQFIPL